MARILTVTNMYPPHHHGGYELQCRDIMARFAARGHECTVLTGTMRVPGVCDPPGEREGGVRRDLRIYWEDHRIPRLGLLERARVERRNQAVLRAALDELRPDVVSVWHMGAMSMGLLSTLQRSAIPLVYVVCDDWLVYAVEQDNWHRLFARRPRAARLVGPAVERLTGLPVGLGDVGASGTFCFVSESTRRTAEQRSRWSFPDATIVYSGIDPTDFPIRVPAPPRWRWKLLYVGRVEPRKGVETAIRALARLPQHATLEVVGRGDRAYLDHVHQVADELGLGQRVCWAVAERGELADRYADADAFVFPVTWDEPFGLVPLEAMACATPVVATATGGSGEFLLDGVNCLRFPPNDAGALASALRRLAEDVTLRERLVAAGQQTARELTVDRLADVLEAWHVAAAERFAGGRPPERPPITALVGPNAGV